MQIPKKQLDVKDQIAARDLLVYLNLNGGKKRSYDKQGDKDEPDYTEFETPSPIPDSKYSKQSATNGDYFDDLIEGNQEFRKSPGKFSKNEKESSSRKGFDTPLANFYHKFANSTIQRYPVWFEYFDTSDFRNSQNFKQNIAPPKRQFNGDGTLNLYESSRISGEIPRKTYRNIDQIAEERRRVDEKTKQVSCMTSISPTITLTDEDKVSFLTDSSAAHENNPYYLSKLRRKYETQTVFRNENDRHRYLDRLKEKFYKHYNAYILAIEAYYKKSDASHAESVEEIYNKILLAFGKYFIALKEINPDSSIPKSIVNCLMATKEVDRFFKIDKKKKNLRRSFMSSKNYKNVASYKQAKKNYLLAVQYYLKALELYEKNPTNVYFQNAVNSYRIVLDTHGVYSNQYERQKEEKQTEEVLLEGRLLKEPEIIDPLIPLPEDPSSSDTERYRVARINYLEWMLLYLKSLVLFYERQNGISESTVTNGYDKLRSRYEEYRKFYERLLSHDALPVEEKMETFIKLIDPPVLDRSFAEIEDHDKAKILHQHDQARLFYYKQLLKYMSELLYIYSVDNKSRKNRLITALNEYKKLNDFRKIYHGIYLYIYDNKLIDSERYPFPNTPDLFTKNSRLLVNFNVEDFSKSDFLLLIEWTEQKRKEYRRLVDSYAEDPKNEVLYRTAVISYEDLERIYALLDYIYRRQSSFAKYGKPTLNVDLKAEIAKLKTPKFMVLPVPVDTKQQAEQLSQETRPEVLSEKIKQIEAEYNVSLLIYNALSDLLRDYKKKDKEELVIDFELASYYRTLNLLYDLCNHFNESPSSKNGKCVILPLPKSISY